MPAVRSPRSPTVRAAAPAAVLVAAVLLLGPNLRGPIVAVSPVLDTQRGPRHRRGHRRAAHQPPGALLGLATLLAAALLARAGLGRGVSVSLVVLIAGIVLRSVDGLGGARRNLLIGIAITVGNVAVPVVIARDLSHRSGPVLGAYTAALKRRIDAHPVVDGPAGERDRLAGSPGVLGRAGVRRTRGLDVCLPSSSAGR